MKIRNKLTLLFTVFFAGLLLLFAFFIYVTSSENRKEEYYSRLQQQAITKANLLMDAKVAPQVLQTIYKNSQNSLLQEEVAVYDTGFHLLYHDAVEIDKVKETKKMIDEIITRKEIRFNQGPLEVAGLLYHHKGTDYVLTAAARDEYGLTKLRNLRNTLIFAYLFVVILTFIVGYFFSGRALKPVSDMVDQVQEITATNLDLRVPVKNEKDEIGELATTFNNMLNRLEQSFDAQKQFVSNISHELRTPLSAIVTELELSLLKKRTNHEYEETIKRALIDTKRLVRLSNGLLDLAKASYDQTEISIKEVRLDELLMEAREAVLRSNPTYKVNIIFEREIEDADFISVKGNEYLLRVAFINLIENGCKFSEDHQSTVAISYFDNKSILRFSDRGVGISEDEQSDIFTAFYRGRNKTVAEGNGIGLSLTKKIVLLHKGKIVLASKTGEGTSFTIELPNIEAVVSN